MIPQRSRRNPLRLLTLEDRTVPAGSIGPFQSVSHSGSLVYEATGGGTLGAFAADGFESGTLGPAWTTYSSTNNGRIQVTGAFGTASGSKALLMDTALAGPNVLNEAIWTVNLAGRANPILKFAHANFNDESNPFTGPFTGHANADGVAVSNDGVNWRPILSAGLFTGWRNETIDLTAALAGTGITLNDPTFHIKFQQFDNFPLPTDGRGFDNIALLAAGGVPDTIEFTVDGGQEMRILVDGEGSLKPRISLTDASGFGMMSATAAAPGGEAALPAVIVPGRIAETNPGPTTYRLKIEGVTTVGTPPFSWEAATNIGDYKVRIVLNADLDREDHGGAGNNTPATAQSLAGDFIPLNRAGTVSFSGRDPSRAAVLGTSDVSPSSGFVDEVEINHPDPIELPPVLPSAQDIDVGGWNLDDDPNFIDPTLIPHLQVDATGDGTFDYYKFTVDADNSFGLFYLNESSFNLFGVVFDSTGLDVGYFDAFGYYYVDLFTAGEYYVGIGTFNTSILAGRFFGEAPTTDYSLLMSVLDHAVNPGGADPLAEVEPNHPDESTTPPPVLTDFAQDLDGETWVLNTDPAVPAANTVPHVRVLGTGDGSFDYFQFTVPAGGGRTIVGLRDSQIFSGFGAAQFVVYDAAGTVVGGGSDFGDFDGVLPAGDYVVGVGVAPNGNFNGQLVGNALQAGESYTLNVSVAGHAYEAPPPDVYAVPLFANETLSVALTGLTPGAPLQLELLAPNGTVVATGTTTPTNVDVALSFRAPPLTGLVGSFPTYYVRVVPLSAGTKYNLVVTRNADAELEGNNSLAAPQVLAPTPGGGRRWVTGALKNTSRVIAATDSGWWTSAGEHNAANTNYVTGITEDGQEYRSFYVFDLSGIEGVVESAVLRAFNPGTPGATGFGNGYASPDPMETLTLFDVSTAIDRLRAGGFGETDIFDDLGTGATYGSYVASPADNGTTISVPLNPAGLSAVQAAGGQFAIGGALTTLGATGELEILFGFTGQEAPTLDVTAKDKDFYQVTVPGNFNLRLDTATPAGGVGGFVNTFDPVVRLYNAAGVLVASNDNGAADGRNAVLSYPVPAGGGGRFYVEVGSSPLTPAPTEGEYILSIVDSRPRTLRAVPAAARQALRAAAAADRGGLAGGTGNWLDLSADGLYQPNAPAPLPVPDVVRPTRPATTPPATVAADPRFRPSQPVPSAITGSAGAKPVADWATTPEDSEGTAE